MQLKKKRGAIHIVIGLLLIGAAVIWTVYNVMDDKRAGKAAESALEQLLPLIPEDPVPEEGRNPAGPSKEEEPGKNTGAEEIEYPDYVLNPNMEMPEEEIDGVNYIGVLTIPSIDRELPVCSEWSDQNLNISPCRYSGSAYLDDMVICAHNYDRFFRMLKNLSYGDEVIFTDMDGNRFTYEVREMITLEPTAVDEMKSGEWDLTLFTCTVGGATRVTVRCEKVER